MLAGLLLLASCSAYRMSEARIPALDYVSVCATQDELRGQIGEGSRAVHAVWTSIQPHGTILEDPACNDSRIAVVDITIPREQLIADPALVRVLRMQGGAEADFIGRFVPYGVGVGFQIEEIRNAAPVEERF